MKKYISIKTKRQKDKLDDSINDLRYYAYNLHYIELIDIEEIDSNINKIKKNYKIMMDIINKAKKENEKSK